MNDSNQRKIGAMLSYVSIIINTLIQLLYTPFLIRMLGQSEYGLYSLVNSIIGYLTVLDLGFGNAIVVYTAKYRAQGLKDKEQKLQGMFKVVFYIIAIISMFLGLILLLNINSLFGGTMDENELHTAKIMMMILIFNLGFSFSFSIYSSIIHAYEKFTFAKVISIIGSILKPIIMIPLLLFGFKSIAMALVLTGINVIISLSNYIYCKKKLDIRAKFKGFDKILFKTILGYSIWIFIGVIVDRVNWSVDQFVLGAVSGTIAVSIYSVASTINTLFLSLSTAISGVFLPKMSKIVAQKATPEELTNEFIKVGRVQYLVMLLVCTGFVLFGKQFIILWTGKEFETSYYVALLLVVPLMIPLIQNLGISIMQAMNKFRFRSISTAIMAVANVGISIVLAKMYGAIGAAIGTTIALVLCNGIIINIYYYKKIKLNVLKFWKEIILMTIPYVIPVGLILLFKHFVILEGWVGLAIYIICYTVLYLLTSYFLSMNKYEKDLVNRVFIKIHSLFKKIFAKLHIIRRK